MTVTDKMYGVYADGILCANHSRRLCVYNKRGTAMAQARRHIQELAYSIYWFETHQHLDDVEDDTVVQKYIELARERVFVREFEFNDIVLRYTGEIKF